MDHVGNTRRWQRAGPPRLLNGNGTGLVEIGRIVVWYVDGSRAADNGFDLVEICDETPQARYD